MNKPEPNVLIVEDEPHMRRFLCWTLMNNGYRTTEAATGATALDQLAEGDIDLVLLDLGLPDVNGVEIAGQIRTQSDVPIIVISARDRTQTKIEALDRGANDYMTKPFSAGELLARMRVAFRLAGRVIAVPKESVFTVGELRVDLEYRQVCVGDQEIHLTPTEYNLLKALIRHAGRVVTHGVLVQEVWGPQGSKDLHLLRVYMRQLRYKIEPEPAQPKYLITVSGVGYRLKTNV